LILIDKDWSHFSAPHFSAKNLELGEILAEKFGAEKWKAGLFCWISVG
jgi:hypothetical protein